MNHVEYRNAYSEVLYLISKMQPENQKKISKNFIDFLEKNKNDNNTIRNISLQNINSLKRETKIVLSIMYRNYFCSPEEKIEKQKADEKALNDLYSYDNIFKRKNKKIISEEKSLLETKNKEIALVEISGYKKIINIIKEKIKKFFSKK